MEAIIFGLIGLLLIEEYFNRKERQKLVDRIIAKSIDELRSMEEPHPVTLREEPPDVNPIETVSDEDFDKAIKKTLGRESLLEKAKDKLKGKVYGR